MAYSTIDDVDGEDSLTFFADELPFEPAIVSAGHEPNGYFWEGVATLLGGDLVKELEFDSETDRFCAFGELAEGFEFDDRSSSVKHGRHQLL